MFFLEHRDKLRQEAKLNIELIQEEQKKNFNKKRIQCSDYKINDVVAIKRTQFGTGLKIKAKYLGPYKIIERQGDKYRVLKIRKFEGPNETQTRPEYMKKWVVDDSSGSEVF